MEISMEYSVGDAIEINHKTKCTYERMGLVVTGDLNWEPKAPGSHVAFIDINKMDLYRENPKDCLVIPERGIARKYTKQEVSDLLLPKVKWDRDLLDHHQDILQLVERLDSESKYVAHHERFINTLEYRLDLGERALRLVGIDPESSGDSKSSQDETIDE